MWIARAERRPDGWWMIEGEREYGPFASNGEAWRDWLARQRANPNRRMFDDD